MPKVTNKDLIARIAELEAELAQAKATAAPRIQKSNRKFEVLALLKEGPHSTAELAAKLDTSKNNIGSLLCYLRKDGVIMHRDNEHRHYIIDNS